MLNLLYRSAAAWTALGLVSGLYYRELTKVNDGFDGTTQLAVAHTHALALGTLMLLVLLALVATLSIDDSRFRWGIWTWQIGLAITFGVQVVKGTLQVLEVNGADSPAIAGIAGLGHVTLTVGFIVLFLGLGSAVRTVSAQKREADLSSPEVSVRRGARYS